MSADNYVVVRKFGKLDYRWAMFFMSDDEVDYGNKHFKSKSFKTPKEAEENAYQELGVIEYGVGYEKGCMTDETYVDYLVHKVSFLEKQVACLMDGLDLGGSLSEYPSYDEWLKKQNEQSS